jgi:hypothetical protein
LNFLIQKLNWWVGILRNEFSDKTCNDHVSKGFEGCRTSDFQADQAKITLAIIIFKGESAGDYFFMVMQT